MLLMEKMAHRQITGANYITSINGMVHPDRVLSEHDFLYMLEGDWEIMEDGSVYESINSFCRMKSISVSSVRDKVRKKGMSLQEAAKYYIERNSYD